MGGAHMVWWLSMAFRIVSSCACTPHAPGRRRGLLHVADPELADIGGRNGNTNPNAVNIKKLAAVSAYRLRCHDAGLAMPRC
jgi:hypothetical protein